MERYPRRKQLHRPNGICEIFSFENEKQYQAKLKEGWVFNPADLKNKKIVVKENKEVVVEDMDKQEEDAENVPEPIIHRPEVPGQINPDPVNPLKCKLCDFVGKSETSLRMHKLHGHKKD